ncbi:hypothetical protein DUNSADRAFT_15009 [Dunaliella salina]|uniref:Uncharacterized protein n=1 Tax=Dunaliella salina TaxID=3046 RepID=A0ABQ7G678_DUNSA|nr:hypothetical protein DUNSADRAFT_15009 [Dunaliella salina]|eukprot:KAF5830118.1 hypothetical protein DUNSADRAFT_15009 [Dunaliella salina]
MRVQSSFVCQWRSWDLASEASRQEVLRPWSSDLLPFFFSSYFGPNPVCAHGIKQLAPADEKRGLCLWPSDLPPFSRPSALAPASEPIEPGRSFLPFSCDGSGEVVLVAFLGGCTYAELSALRLLSASPASQGTQFLALTTKVVTGSTLLSGFIDPAVVRSCRATGLQV